MRNVRVNENLHQMMHRRLLLRLQSRQVQVVLPVDVLHVQERRWVDNQRMRRPLLTPRRNQSHLSSILCPSVRLHGVCQQHPLSRARFHHRHRNRHIHVLLGGHLQRRLHRSSTHYNLLRRTRHRLIARRTDNARILTAYIATRNRTNWIEKESIRINTIVRLANKT